jgi:hypothetical protein
MVYLQTKNSNRVKFWRALEWKMLAYVIYGKLEYLTPTGYTLWLFGILSGHLLYFSQDWYAVPRKSGNPIAGHEIVDINFFAIAYIPTQQFVRPYFSRSHERPV